MVILVIAYIAVIIAANITATWFVGPIAIGTLLFGAIFTLRDRLHAHGRRVVYSAICASAIGSAIVALVGGAEWRVIVASVVALVLSEATDTEIYHRTAGAWLRRVAWSNAAAIPLDTALFNAIAFWGVLPLSFLVSVFAADIVIKVVTSGVIAWFLNSSIAPAAIHATPK